MLSEKTSFSANPVLVFSIKLINMETFIQRSSKMLPDGSRRITCLQRSFLAVVSVLPSDRDIIQWYKYM